jgi:hypothetical protein
MSVRPRLDCERRSGERKSLNLRDIFLALATLFD